MTLPLSALHIKASGSCKIQVLNVSEILQLSENETFEKRSILFKAKEGDNFNHTNTLSILRIKI